MADIVFDYTNMNTIAGQIRDVGNKYKTAASTLETDFIAAISSWEGETKEAMQRFISGPVMDYTRDTVPQLLEALATLLEANAEQMAKADSEISNNIPTTLG